MKDRNIRFTIPFFFLLMAFVSISLVGAAEAPIEEANL